MGNNLALLSNVDQPNSGVDSHTLVTWLTVRSIWTISPILTHMNHPRLSPNPTSKPPPPTWTPLPQPPHLNHPIHNMFLTLPNPDPANINHTTTNIETHRPPYLSSLNPNPTFNHSTTTNIETQTYYLSLPPSSQPFHLVVMVHFGWFWFEFGNGGNWNCGFEFDGGCGLNSGFEFWRWCGGIFWGSNGGGGASCGDGIFRVRMVVVVSVVF